LPLPDPTKVPAMLGGLTVNPYYQGIMEHSGFNEWNRVYGFGKLKFNYDLPYGFGLAANFDMNRTFFRDRLRKLEMPQYDYDAETDTYTVRRTDFGYNFLQEQQSINKNFNQQYFLTWDRSLGDHDFNALFVYEELADHYDYFRAFRRDYEFPIDYLFAGPDANKDNTGHQREGGRKAYIARINYNYQGKYLFEVSGRADGSPRFPAESRWGYFPSASIGWRISEESFMRDNLPILTNLKLRASHGMLGYDAAGAFQYLSTFSMRTGYLFGTDPSAAIRADAMPNPNITWEKMTISNFGIDYNLGNFLEGSVDYFYRLRTDVLGSRLREIPDVVGASLPNENFREYDNRGWEFALNHINRIGDFSYNIGGNISTNREKTVYTDQAAFTSMEAERRGNVIGEWTDRFWAYQTDGFFQSWEEIWEIDFDIDGQGNRTIRPGDIRYIDTNGDGVITADDMIIAGRGVMPRLMFGIDLSLSWKNFDFMMLWQGAGNYNYNLRAGGRDFIMPFYSENTPTMFMYENQYVEENPWMATNTTDALWPRFGLDYSNRSHRNYNLNNDFWLTPGTYVRLKNVQLGYTIPQRITQRWNISNLKVFVSGYDVLTLTPTPYKFIDPEIDTSPARAFGDYHPTVGTYNFGVQMNF
jgi:TonB-linked SusC/RagA family outer membrane protein